MGRCLDFGFDQRHLRPRMAGDDFARVDGQRIVIGISRKEIEINALWQPGASKDRIDQLFGLERPAKNPEEMSTPLPRIFSRVVRGTMSIDRQRHEDAALLQTASPTKHDILCGRHAITSNGAHDHAAADSLGVQVHSDQ